MNIFYLDHDPSLAAQMHCDKHVVKMILETAQIMSTVARAKCALNHIETPSDLYQPTHVNHPSVLWAGESWSNYCWVYLLGCNLGNEYNLRYGKEHKSMIIIWQAWKTVTISDFELHRPTTIRQCMPEQYQIIGDPVGAYRSYYIGEKTRMFNWKVRGQPDWVTACNDTAPGAQ